MTKLSEEQCSALRLVGQHPHGCAEALLLKQGFELAMLGDLVFGGFVLATPQDAPAGSQRELIVWMTITAAGRRAIAE
jgi:hypothetical protein